MLSHVMDPTGKQERLMLLLSHTGIQFQTDATGGFEQKAAYKHTLQMYIYLTRHLHK